MLFVEPVFFLFFALVLSVYWALPSNSARKSFLLIASYVFYGAWDWRFALMLLLISSADYAFAHRIDRAEDAAVRKRYVVASLVMNLGVLGYFKYCNFFLASAVSLAAAFGLTLSQPTLHILLPVGISFLTFQSLSYTIDVYRRQLKPARVMRDYLLFAAFFPQLVAGPIVRPAYFLPQLQEKRRVNGAQVQAALLLFLLGFVKKTGIADNFAPFVDQVFATPEAYGTLASITAVWLYAAQIYCDFSGYSDMAIAVAALMGYKLVLNFNAPYLSTSIQEFWRRWHISLSTWIRDYIYISLGGRMNARWKTYRNLLLTMLAGGLWHGAAWTFVVWGGLHGVALVVQREWVRRYDRWVQRNAVATPPALAGEGGAQRSVGVLSAGSEIAGSTPTPPSPAGGGGRRTAFVRLLGWFFTLNFICLAWIFFRADSFSTAHLLVKRYLLLEPGGSGNLPLWLLALPPALLFFEYTSRRFAWYESLAARRPWVFALLYGAAWAVALPLLPLGSRPFIYFQF